MNSPTDHVVQALRHLRSRADSGMEVHGQKWCEGVRFAANQIESELRAYDTAPAIASPAREELERLADDFTTWARNKGPEGPYALIERIRAITARMDAQEPVAWPKVYGEPPDTFTREDDPNNDGSLSPEQCAKWLDAKFARHHELEDRACAQMIRALAAAYTAPKENSRE